MDILKYQKTEKEREVISRKEIIKKQGKKKEKVL